MLSGLRSLWRIWWGERDTPHSRFFTEIEKLRNLKQPELVSCNLDIELQVI